MTISEMEETAPPQAVSLQTESVPAFPPKNKGRFLADTALVILVAGLSLNAMFLVVVPHGTNLNVLDEWLIGYLLGTIYSHAFLAAAWFVFGPGPRVLRRILSPLWLLGTFVALWLHFNVHGLPDDGFLIVILLLLAGQWLLSMLIMASSAAWLKYRLIASGAQTAEAVGKNLKFKVRDLLILTSISAVFLALGKAFLPSIVIGTAGVSGGEVLIFVYLSIAAVLTTLPLGISVLIGRYAIFALPSMIIWIALATWIESAIFSAPGLSGPNRMHLIAINTVSSLVVIFATVSLAIAGYRLKAIRV